MNIIVVGPYPPFRGGIADLNYALVKNLSRKHVVNVINFTTQYPSLLFPGKTQYKPDFKPSKFESERLVSSINPWSWKRTADRILDQSPDFVIFRYWMPFFAIALGNIAKKIKGISDIPILAICDNIIPHERRLFDTFLTRYFLTKVDRFIVLSKSVERDLIYLNPSAIYRYSPHPIYNIFGDALDKMEARQKLGISSEKVILYFGLIREYKGLDILINAAGELKNHLENFKVLVVGECYENPEKYENLVKQNNVENIVELKLEFVPDEEVASYFSAADVVALPYRSATQSGIVQIAYHFNRPVIVSNVGGLPEIVPDGEVGYVVEPIPIEFSRAIREFYEYKKEAEFSANIAMYKKRFSWDNMINTIEELIAE